MRRAKIKKVSERDQTGEKWRLYEIEIPYETTHLIIEYER